MANTFLIWQPPSSYGNHLPNMATTFLIWQLSAMVKLRPTYEGPISFDSNGFPLNPRGRTGLRGRGLLGLWGPNHTTDPIVTRFHPQTNQLQALVAVAAAAAVVRRCRFCCIAVVVVSSCCCRRWSCKSARTCATCGPCPEGLSHPHPTRRAIRGRHGSCRMARCTQMRPQRRRTYCATYSATDIF